MKTHGAHLPFSHLLIYKIFSPRLGQLTSRCCLRENVIHSFIHFVKIRKMENICGIEPEQIELTIDERTNERKRREEENFSHWSCGERETDWSMDAACSLSPSHSLFNLLPTVRLFHFII